MNPTVPPARKGPPPQPSDDATTIAGGRAGLLARHPWLGYLLPLIVFLVITSIEPTPSPELAEVDPVDAQEGETAGQSGWFGLAIPYRAYPLVYTAKIALTIAAMAFVWPVYRQFSWRLSPLAVAIGGVGAVLWIGICHLQIEQRVLPSLGLQSVLGSGQRSGFNPLVEMADQPVLAAAFLAIRLVGLVLVVPVIEEFFLRGFLMRFCVNEAWWNVPFGTVNRLALVIGTAVPMAMHTGELLAAGVWFSLISGLMVLTRDISDCVAAHATTNLLLGLYVISFNQWQLM